MSYILARDGHPPFVLTVDNAKAYFDPSTLITKKKKEEPDPFAGNAAAQTRIRGLSDVAGESKYLLPKARA